MNDTSKWNQSGTRCDYRIHSNSIREQSGRRNTFLPGSGSYQLFVSWLSAASSADTPYRWLHCRTWMKTPRPSGDLNVSSNTSSTKPHHKIIFQISSFLFVFPFVSFSSILFVFCFVSFLLFSNLFSGNYMAEYSKPRTFIQLKFKQLTNINNYVFEFSMRLD